MKTKKSIALAVGLSTLTAFPLFAGIGVGIRIYAPAPPPPPPPVVVVAPPPPGVTVTVPESYVYDGSEYVGVVGSQYYYLGPGNVWLTLDGPRFERWHRWEVGHADWREHTIRNERYRGETRGRDFHDRDHDHRDRGHRW